MKLKLIVEHIRHYRWNNYKQGWYWETYWRVCERSHDKLGFVITERGLQRWPMTQYDKGPLEFEDSKSAVSHIKEHIMKDYPDTEIKVNREISEISPGNF